MEKKNVKANRILICPLRDQFCKGKLCILWDNPENAQLEDIRSNCLVRIGIQKFIKSVKGDKD